MKSEYKILIASSILAITLIVISDISLTTSWFSDVEETDVNVSILSIEIKDNETGTSVTGSNWQWNLYGGRTYLITATANTHLRVQGSVIVIIDGNSETRNIIDIGPSGTTIIADSNATLSLFPPS